MPVGPKYQESRAIECSRFFSFGVQSLGPLTLYVTPSYGPMDNDVTALNSPKNMLR